MQATAITVKPAQDAHTTAALITLGFTQPRLPMTFAEVLKAYGENGGVIELFSELASWAEPLARIIETYVEHAESAPGVFDYEVSEEFGTWYAAHLVEHCEVPTTAQCWTQIEAMCFAFFVCKGDTPIQQEADRAMTRAVLDAVRASLKA